MRALPFLHSLILLAIFAVYTTNAACVISTDDVAKLHAAGYEWESFVQLKNITSIPRPPYDNSDMFAADTSADGRFNLSIRVVVPRRNAPSTQNLWLSNDLTTNVVTGAQVNALYRIIIWLYPGPGGLPERAAYYLLGGQDHCKPGYADIRFAADDIEFISAERLIKL